MRDHSMMLLPLSSPAIPAAKLHHTTRTYTRFACRFFYIEVSFILLACITIFISSFMQCNVLFESSAQICRTASHNILIGGRVLKKSLPERITAQWDRNRGAIQQYNGFGKKILFHKTTRLLALGRCLRAGFLPFFYQSRLHLFRWL